MPTLLYVYVYVHVAEFGIIREEIIFNPKVARFNTAGSTGPR